MFEHLRTDLFFPKEEYREFLKDFERTDEVAKRLFYRISHSMPEVKIETETVLLNEIEAI